MEEQQQQQHPAVQLALDGGAAATAVAHSASGDRAAACSHITGQVRAWAVSPSGAELAPLHEARVAGGGRVLAWSPAEHGAVLAVGTGAGTLHFFAAGGGGGWSDSGALPCGRGAVTDAAFAPWQLGLLLAASSADGHVYVYEGSPAAAGAGAGAAAAGAAAAPGSRALAWTLHSRFAAAQPTAAAAAAALLPSAAAPSPCGCVAWRGGGGGGGGDTGALPPLLLAGSGPGRAASVWAYDAGAMAWRRAVSLEPPPGGPAAAAAGGDDDGIQEQAYPETARACAWAPSLGRADELLAVALGGGGGGGGGDVALYRLPLPSQSDGGGSGGWPARLRPAQTLRHAWNGLPLAAWRLQFNATGTALAASVEEEQQGGGGGGRGGGGDGGDGGGPPPQVWFWMPNLESGVWRAVAGVEGGEDFGANGGEEEDDRGVMMLGQ